MDTLHETELPLRREAVRDALKRALREMGDFGHINASHFSGEPFTYAPYSCPACARAVIKRLIDGEKPE